MLVLLAACGLDADNFRTRQNEEACRNSEACASNTFAIEYGSVAACVDAFEESYGTLYTCERKACAFDEDDAQACLDNLAGATCEDVADGDAWTRCDSVFTDCDDDAYQRCMDDA